MNIINEICKEFRRKRAELEVPISEVRDNLSKFDAILLYGAGSSGIAFLDFMRRQGMDADYFVDANESKIGTFCEGLKILSPDEIKDTVRGNVLVIVCINTDGIRYCKSFDAALRIGGHHAVYDRLHRCGCKNVIDYSYFRHCFALFKGEKYNAPSCSDVDLMMEHETEVAQVYELLSDEGSRDIYEKIIRFRLLDDTLKVPTMPQDRQYFELDFYRPRNDAVFVDCGAYNGISLRAFLKENGAEFQAYYGMEPDTENFQKLRDYVETLAKEVKNKINFTTKAAWDHSDEVLKLYALHGPGSFMANDIGTETVKSVTIDEMLRGGRATFIKMNIEGSEKQALRGAEKTIRSYKPQLAIAGYHRTCDLWEVPLLMMGFQPDYRLSLGSYMNHISFVYYAE